MKKVYFAGSIRGGRVDASLYQRMIEYIKKTDIVLTEHVGDLSLSLLENENNDQRIYRQDTGWLKECDLLIAECSCPSLGVGYELAYAEKLNKPCYIFYNHQVTELSAMLKGNDYYHIYAYDDIEEVFLQIDKILER